MVLPMVPSPHCVPRLWLINLVAVPMDRLRRCRGYPFPSVPHWDRRLQAGCITSLGGILSPSCCVSVSFFFQRGASSLQQQPKLKTPKRDNPSTLFSC